MNTGNVTARHHLTGALSRIDARRVFAHMAAVLITLAMWTQLQPFQNWQDHSVGQAMQSNDLRRLVVLVMVFGCTAAVLWMGRARRLLSALKSPALMLTFSVIMASVFISGDTSSSLGRFVLLVATILIAFSMPLLLESVEEYASFFATAILTIAVLSLLGVLLAPDLSIHSFKDVDEQALDGSWRGVFGHKNDLSYISAISILFAIFMTGVGRPLAGLTVIFLSILLLLMSGGKTAMLLILPTIVISHLLYALRRNNLAIGLFILLISGSFVGLTIFSATSGSSGLVLAGMRLETSFTGRAEAWALSIEAIARSPWLGYGYSIFWDTAVHSIADANSPAARFSHAHNWFLELALSSGIPAVLFATFWIIVKTSKDIGTVLRRVTSPSEKSFAIFHVRVFLLCLMSSFFEATILHRANPVWFTMLLSLACLHYWARSLRAPR